jgi:zinc D-Ala-D-Ala carboxypeptidase
MSKDNISKHLSYDEGVRSVTAIRKGIDNTPGPYELKCMKETSEFIFEPIRKRFNVPIRVNSFYRSKALNTAVGGSRTSQHTKGQAVDIDDTLGGLTNKEIFDYVRCCLDFDQMIWEYGSDENPDWVHISYVGPGANRNRCLRTVVKNGKTSYKVI